VNARERVSHEQAANLLPWLVNDSLDSEEKEGVLEHSRICVICRRELDELVRLRDSVARPTADIPAPDMRRINARIDDWNDRRNWGQRLIRAARKATDNPWRIGFVAQTVLLLVLATLLFMPAGDDPAYTTLTDPDSLPAGAYVRIVFTPEIDQTELTMFLDRFELSVVGGPSARGVYTLELADAMSLKDRDNLLLYLQGDSRVLFAQPVVHGVEQ
jgi:hypothetical protein